MNSELVSIRRLMSPLNAPMPTSALLHDPNAARSSDFVSPLVCIFMAFSPWQSDLSVACGALGHAWRADELFLEISLRAMRVSAPARRRTGGDLVASLVPPRLCGSAMVDQGPVRGCAGPLLDEDIAAGGAIEDVLPEAADQYVVSRFANESVVAVAADQ